MQLLLSTDSTVCGDALLAQITTELTAGKRVLWFLTGGSNISLDMYVMSRLSDAITKNLVLTLTDERFGDYGHADSNWQQLKDKGFDAKQARAFAVLQEDNQSLEQTTAIYASNLDIALSEADSVIGFYGLGTDGHIAGILPGTDAVTATGYAVGYETDAFTRITSTFQTIRRCDVAFMYAAGESKQNALRRLQTDLPLSEQPAQVLKQLPQAFIYNDHTGDRT